MTGTQTLERPQFAHMGETSGIEDHDYDLIQYLAVHLESLWRCDQRIANAEGDEELQGFWRGVKEQEMGNAERARELIRRHVKKECF